MERWKLKQLTEDLSQSQHNDNSQIATTTDIEEADYIEDTTTINTITVNEEEVYNIMMNNTTTNNTTNNNNTISIPFVVQSRGNNLHDANDDDSDSEHNVKNSNIHSTIASLTGGYDSTTSSHTNVENVAVDISSLPIQKNIMKNDETNRNKEDFIITLDLQEDDNDTIKSKDNDDKNDLWLIVTDQYYTVTENEHGSVRRRKGLGIITSSSNKRDEYIKNNINNLPNNNGYTLKNISSLEQLRNDLNTICFPSPQSQLLQLHDGSNCSNNNTSAIICPNSSEIKKVNNDELNEIKRFQLFRQIIQHEDDSLNKRVSLIIVAQSFLMAAFITSTGPITLRYVTAFVGLATIVVAMPAIIAAGRNIEIQQQVYFNMVESDDRCYALHGHRRDYKKLEVEEAMRRKHYGHLLPTMAFRGNGAFSTLTTVTLLGVVQFIGWFLLLISLIVS